MKSSVIFSFLIGALIISGCRKDDNEKVPDFQKVPIPLITFGEGSNEKIPEADPASYNATVVVDTYFKNGELPKQLDLVVVKNGDNSNKQVIQAAITTFPTTVNVTGQQLRDLFGADIVLGDKFEIGADVTTLDGKTFSAFLPDELNYAPGINNLPGSSPEIALECVVFCAFVPADFTTGAYEVVEDEWQDYAVGSSITVTQIDDTHYSFKYAADNANPIVITVNEDQTLTIDPVMYGDYGGAQVTATGVAGSEVKPCDKSFHIILNHNAPDFGGDLGDYAITLKKL